MKTKNKMLWINLFSVGILALINTTSVLAEHGPGNSGNAVERDGKYYLLDFVEAGIEEVPNLEVGAWERTDYIPRVKNWANKTLVDFELEDRVQIANQLSRLEFSNPFAASVLLFAINLHSWSFVNYPLKDITEDDSSISIPPEKLHQLAVRRGKSIQIRKDYWKKMDAWNRVGTVFHEGLFSLAKLEKDQGGEWIQKSWGVRQIVGQFFKSSMSYFQMNRAISLKTDGTNVLPFMDFEGHWKPYAKHDLLGIPQSPIFVNYGEEGIQFISDYTAYLGNSDASPIKNASQEFEVGVPEFNSFLEQEKIQYLLNFFCEKNNLVKEGKYPRSDMLEFSYSWKNHLLQFASYKRKGESLDYLQLSTPTYLTVGPIKDYSIPPIYTVDDCKEQTLSFLKERNQFVEKLIKEGVN